MGDFLEKYYCYLIRIRYFFVRWSFDIACAHLFYLMTSDSYSRSIHQQNNKARQGCILFIFRYIRSSHYKDLAETAKKKTGKSFAIPKLSSAKQMKMKSISCRVEFKCLYISYNTNPLTMTLKMPNHHPHCAIILVILTLLYYLPIKTSPTNFIYC